MITAADPQSCVTAKSSMAAVTGKSITVVVATPMLDATKEPRSHSGGLQMRSFDTGKKPLTQYLIRFGGMDVSKGTGMQRMRGLLRKWAFRVKRRISGCSMCHSAARQSKS